MPKERKSKLRNALEEAMLRYATSPGGTSPPVSPLPSTPEVRKNLKTVAKGAAIALPAGAADIGGLVSMAASQPFSYAGPGAPALRQQAEQQGLDMGGLEHPPFSGDPIRELVGNDPGDPWGIAGEVMDPSMTAVKGFAMLLKAGMTALKTGVNMSGALAAMAPIAKVLSKRGVKGDALLNTQDRLDDLAAIGAEVSDEGMVTIYHATSRRNAENIAKTGKMSGKEDNLFFSTKPDGEISGYGDTVIKTEVPIERLEIDDIFPADSMGLGSEAHVTLKGPQAYVRAEVLPVPLADKEIVSTRLPTAVKAIEDPVTEYLQVGLDAARRDPNAFKKNVSVVTNYPNYRPKAGRTAPDARAEAFIEHVEDNLIWLHDQVPAPIRDRSSKWYDGTSVIVDRFGQNYPGLERRQYGGVIAVLSPQKDWYQNASLAERVLSIRTQVLGHKFDTAMTQAAARMPLSDVAKRYVNTIDGKTLGELTDPIEQAWWVRLFDEAHNHRDYPIISPEGDAMGLATRLDGEPKRVAWGSAGEIAKAISIIEDGSPQNISRQLGGMHKVRSFNNNVIDPNNPLGDVTIDTHAVAAGLLRPLSGNSLEVTHAFGGTGSASSSVHGVQGTYPLYAEAYRRAAQQRGLLPRQMQSITWEAGRGLFTPVFKRNKRAIEQVDRIWTQYRNKQISLNEARRSVHEIAQGIDPPEWHRLDTVLDAAQGNPNQPGQLPVDSLRFTRPRAIGGGGDDAAAELADAGVDLGRFDQRLKDTLR